MIAVGVLIAWAGFAASEGGPVVGIGVVIAALGPFVVLYGIITRFD